MSHTSIDTALAWRYATKKYDPAKKVSEADLEAILEAARMAASSFGLQPWKMILVTDPATRARLREAAFNQPQITDASHLVVFAVEKKIDEAYVDEFVSLVSKTRDVPVENLKGYRDMMTSFIARFSQTERDAWAGKQAYIALGTALVAAAEREVDSTPMEGFSHEAVDAVLELEKHGLGSAVILALGYRAADDDTAHYKKVRFPREEMLIQK